MKKNYILQLLLLTILTYTLDGQSTYYKITLDELILTDNKKQRKDQLLEEHNNIIVADQEYVLTFNNSYVNHELEFDDFIFSSVTLYEIKSFRFFEKLNLESNPPFKYNERIVANENNPNFVSTGNTKVINSKLCHEYESKHPFKNTYYIDKSLPFINYLNLPAILPGFVTSYTEDHFGIPITIIKKLEEIDYDEKYFRYIHEFKKSVPPLISFTEENYTHNSNIPKNIVRSVNHEYFHSYHPHIKNMESHQKYLKHDIRNKLVSLDLSNWAATYYDRNYEQVYKVKFESNTAKKDVTPAPKMIGDSLYIQYRRDGTISTKSTLNKSTLKHVYEYANLGSKFITNLNNSYQPQSSIHYNDNGILETETTYFYNKNNQLTSQISNNLLKNETGKVLYAYHPNGLLKEKVTDYYSTNIKYIYKPGFHRDTLHILENRSKSTSLHKILHYDKNDLLRIKNTSGGYNDKRKYDYNFYDNSIPTHLIDLESQIRMEYLDLFCKADSIRTKIRDPKDKKSAFDNLCNHEFVTIQLKNFTNRNSIENYLEWFPDIEILELEAVHKDDLFEYYKVFYRETLDGRINKKRGNYIQTIRFFESTFGKNTFEANPINWTFKLIIDTRYLIIKKNLTTQTWQIDLH